MKYQKLFALVLAALMVLFTLAGCGGQNATKQNDNSGSGTEKAPAQDSAASGDDDSFTIATIEPESMDATNKPLYDNLKHTVEALGGTYLGVTVSEDSPDGYLNSIRNMISAGADGIILSFVVSNYGLLPTVADMCDEAGVYWALFWNNLHEGTDDYKIAMASPHFIASTSEDDIYSAHWAASIVGEMGCKNLCTITLPEGLTTTNLRNEGVAKACEEYGMTVLGTCSDKSLTYSSAGGATITEDFMTVYPDMDAIVICGPQYALPGVYKALRDAGRTDIQVAAVDYTDYQHEYMQDGTLDGIIGGHFSGPIFSTILMANAIQGNPLVEGGQLIQCNFIALSTVEEAQQYYEQVSGNFFYSDEELANCLVKNNPDFTFEAMMEMVNAYSLEDIISRMNQ